MTSYNVRAIVKELHNLDQVHNHKNSDLDEMSGLFLDDELANQMSSETHFSAETDKMYYFVREPQHESSTNEGFSTELVVESEFGDGYVCIDGSIKYDIAYGDKVTIDVKPEYRLKCMKFIM